ncbi:translation protein SH3-like domain-containing protein [Spinellus fusiger]|nr:translation protein SH3-like domain-containing protein [Spinellus fusiger]
MGRQCVYLYVMFLGHGGMRVSHKRCRGVILDTSHLILPQPCFFLMLRLGAFRWLQPSTRTPLTPLVRSVTPASSFSVRPTTPIRWTRPYTTKPTTTTTPPPPPTPTFLSGFSTEGKVATSAQASATPSKQFKVFKPSTPGKRWVKRVPRDHLYKGKAVRSLTVEKRGNGGRNNAGRITIRHQGAGHKRRIRMIDWHRAESGSQLVVRLEHDPGRSAWIALLRHKGTGKESYIVAPHGVKPGDVLKSYRALDTQPTDTSGAQAITRVLAIDVGNCMPLKMIPVGTLVHNVGLKRNGPAVMVRSAGTYAQLIQTGETGYAQLRLSSGEVRLVPVDACATIGSVSNPDHQHEMLGKAGRSRWLGIRPTVRGTAMNTCDHPHGGGRGKSKGNKHPRSPWGVLAKGGKTRKTENKFVVKPRPRR